MVVLTKRGFIFGKMTLVAEVVGDGGGRGRSCGGGGGDDGGGETL